MPRPMPKEFHEPCWKALCDLLSFFDGNRRKAAREIGVNYSAIYQWISRGAVGMTGALRIHYNPNIPFTKEMLRPDRTKKEWKIWNGQYDRNWMSPARMKRDGQIP